MGRMSMRCRRRQVSLERLPPCSLPGSLNDIVNQQMEKKLVQLSLDRAEPHVELGKELHHRLDLIR